MEAMSVSEIAALFHTFEPTTKPTPPQWGRHSRPRSNPALAYMCGSARNTEAGLAKEEDGMRAYTKLTGNCVTLRNDHNIKMRIRCADDVVVDVVGRPDGFCEDKKIVVEHKYRVHGLLAFVPFHEEVQCHLYMHMLGISCAHLVQTFGTQMRIHEILFSQATWMRILDAIRCGQPLNQNKVLEYSKRIYGGDPPAETGRNTRHSA